jgi:uncharacterized LabA/DUF88 family protein
MIFMDGSNLFKACEGYRKEYRIDIEKLRDKLVNGRTLMRTYYYCSISNPPRQEQIKFQEKLRFLHLEVNSKTLKIRGSTGEMIEKGVDVALATDMLSLAFRNAYDVAVLVSGDNDFLQAVDEVKRAGKRVEIACFSSSIGHELRMKADDFIPIDQIADEIELKLPQKSD